MRFSGDEIPSDDNIIESKIKIGQIDDEIIKIHVWNTSGQEDLFIIKPEYYDRAMGVLLLYDITNRQSFINVRKWLKNIEEYGPKNVIKILIGTRCHLSEKRKIAVNQAQELAEECGILFIEASAEKNINVKKAFSTITREILSRMNMAEEKESDESQNRSQGVLSKVYKGWYGAKQREESKRFEHLEEHQIKWKNNKAYQFKLILVGESKTGKSTIAPTMKYSVSLQDCAVEFGIYDKYDGDMYDEAAAAIVVYDITSSESFDTAKIWIKELQRKCRNGIVIALVGNKIDKEQDRKVTTADAKQYANDNFQYFMEISAKTGTNVEELFRLIAQKVSKV